MPETVGLSLKDLKLSDSNDDIFVALKKLKPNADKVVKEAFEQEIKYTSRLDHEHVVRLFGICSSGNPFRIMHGVHGEQIN